MNRNDAGQKISLIEYAIVLGLAAIMGLAAWFFKNRLTPDRQAQVEKFIKDLRRAVQR